MVLVEGAGGDGVTLDTSVAVPNANAGPAEQVAAAILGTRESVLEGAHRLGSVGVAWTDHGDGARLREVLQANGIHDVVMVSELHAASALAQAVGRRTGCTRIALFLLERDDVTLAVVRTVDGAVVAVHSRALHTADAVEELREMVAGLERTAEPPDAVFLMGAGRDMATLASSIAEATALPVHGPDDADLALARGAALAAATRPRFEAATVGVVAQSAGPTSGGFSAATVAGVTQLAAAGYLAPLGYSAVVPDGDDEEIEADDVPGAQAPAEAADKPFLLVGSMLATIFVVGVAALLISLVRISPAVEQRPEPGEPRTPPAPAAAQISTPAQPSIETIEAPRPVVQEAPRTVYVPAPVRQAPAPVVLPAPAPAAPVPAVAPEPVVVPEQIPAVPAPVVPPIVFAPIIPLLPPLLQPSIQVPVPVAPRAPVSSAPSAPTTAPAPSVTSAPASTATAAAPLPSSAAAVPSADAPAPDAGQRPRRGGSGSDSGPGSQGPLWPLWPTFGR